MVGGYKKRIGGLKKQGSRGLNKKGFPGSKKKVWGLKKMGRLEKKGMGVKKNGSPIRFCIYSFVYFLINSLLSFIRL